VRGEGQLAQGDAGKSLKRGDIEGGMNEGQNVETRNKNLAVGGGVEM